MFRREGGYAVEKRDLAKELGELYSPPKGRFVVVDVPEMSFLMVDGTGSPETSPAFQEAIGALYSVAYTLKFTFKKEHELDWKVMPLEGLFSTDESGRLDLDGKGEWRWTLMLLQPDSVTKEDVARAAETAGRKKPLPGLKGLRFARFSRGALRPDAAPGPLRGRAADDRGAPRLHRGGGVRSGREAPRDLPERPDSHQAGAVEDPDPPAGEEGLTAPRRGRPGRAARRGRSPAGFGAWRATARARGRRPSGSPAFPSSG